MYHEMNDGSVLEIKDDYNYYKVMYMKFVVFM